MAITEFQPKVYFDVVEFLARGPSPQQIVTFRPSTQTQKRVTELLAKSKKGDLKSEETIELDHYEYVEHLMCLVKAKVQLNLKDELYIRDNKKKRKKKS